MTASFKRPKAMPKPKKIQLLKRDHGFLKEDIETPLASNVFEF